jgi:DNA topoisomerase-1
VQTWIDAHPRVEQIEPIEVACEAGLRYLSDDAPGIHRTWDHRRDAFRYRGPDGRPVKDAAVLERIEQLKIPPAWTDVWISPLAESHLQATGRDARGRKQYRYHARWRAVRDETKFCRMLSFGEALPVLREHLAVDLARADMPREKVLAALVTLLDRTHLRVGNDEYVRENHTFGVTTLRRKHVDVQGSTIRFRFRGKGGKEREVSLRDRRLARIIRRCRDLPGYCLFEYTDELGDVRTIDSDDVNAYLRSITGQDFTAKDFRTWAGTVVAANALRQAGPHASEIHAKHVIADAVRATAEHLGNTPAVCRKCYIHPAVIDTYLDGSLHEPTAVLSGESGTASSELRPEEAWALQLLRRATPEPPLSRQGGAGHVAAR